MARRKFEGSGSSESRLKGGGQYFRRSNAIYQPPKPIHNHRSCSALQKLCDRIHYTACAEKSDFAETLKSRAGPSMYNDTAGSETLLEFSLTGHGRATKFLGEG